MIICQPEQEHAALLSRYYLDNEARFRRWSPVVEADYHTVPAWRKRLRERQLDSQAGRCAHFIGLDEARTQVLGACSLTNIMRGPFQACHLGYSVNGDHEGQGVMAQIVRHAIDYGFGTLGLNRIMANHMPGNDRSAALLRRLGFEREGYARRYLRINGRWEDHVLNSLLRPEPDYASRSKG